MLSPTGINPAKQEERTVHPYLTGQYLYERNSELDRLAAKARTSASAGRDGPEQPLRQGPHRLRLSLVLPRRARQAVGRRLVQVGGRVALDGCPTPAPCPWCDLAFPAPERRGDKDRIQVPC